MRFDVLTLGLWAVTMTAFFQTGFGDHSCGALLTTYKGFTACASLPKLGSTLAWAIHNATNSVDFAFSGAWLSQFGLCLVFGTVFLCFFHR
jgi:hypothetical protein